MTKLALSTLLLTLMLAPALAQTTPEQHQIYKDKPNGQGDPAAISCYRPPSSLSRVSRLECRPNSEWAQIAAHDRESGLDLGNRAGGAPVNVTP